MINLKDAFDKYEDEFLKFDRIENRFSNRPDLHAFILLDKLVPGNRDMISCSAHDEYYLSITPDELAAVATEEQIMDLHRCGVRYDEGEDSLCLFA